MICKKYKVQYIMISWKWLKTESENPLFSYVANFLLNEPGEVRKQIKALNDITVNLIPKLSRDLEIIRIEKYKYANTKTPIQRHYKYKHTNTNLQGGGRWFGDYSDGEARRHGCFGWLSWYQQSYHWISLFFLLAIICITILLQNQKWF